MTDSNQSESDLTQFILDEIDSVPHLEALLLLWNSRPSLWTIGELAKRLYVEADVAQVLLQDLARKRLITAVKDPGERYRYEPLSGERDQLIGVLDQTYRRQVVRVSNMIHSKPSSAVRDFARAFRFKREKD